MSALSPPLRPMESEANRRESFSQFSVDRCSPLSHDLTRVSIINTRAAIFLFLVAEKVCLKRNCVRLGYLDRYGVNLKR